MLVAYVLTMYLNRNDLADNPQIGLFDNILKLSTAPFQNAFQILDKSSFSEIGQENMIIYGGELSLMNDCKIDIVSPELLDFFAEQSINPFAIYADLSAFIAGNEKILFERMKISEYTQKDEISFSITLADSSFEKASITPIVPPSNYSVPEVKKIVGAGDFVPVYEIYKSSAISTTPRKIINGNGRLIPFGNSFFCDSVILSETEGALRFDYYDVDANGNSGHSEWYIEKLPIGTEIEVYSGAGKGNKYSITKIETTAQECLVYIGQPLKEGEIKGFITRVVQSNTPYMQKLPANPALYTYDSKLRELLHDKARIALDPAQGGTNNKLNLNDISFFRINEQRRFFLCQRIVIPEISTSTVASLFYDNGEKSIRLPIPFSVTYRTADYEIFCINSQNEIVEVLQNCECRFERAKATSNGIYGANTYTSFYLPNNNLVNLGGEWLAENGEIIPNTDKNILVSNFQTKANTRGRMYYNFCFIWDLEKVYLLDDELQSFYPDLQISDFGIAGYTNADSYSARVMLMDTNAVVLESKFYDMSDNRFRGNFDSEKIKEYITFDSKPVLAKYIYMQVSIEIQRGYLDVPAQNYNYTIKAKSAGIKVKYKIDFDKLKADLSFYYMGGILLKNSGNAIKAVRNLCLQSSVNIDNSIYNYNSIEQNNFKQDTGSDNYNTSVFYEIDNDTNISDLLRDTCRASNFSIVSNGNKLSIKYFPTDRETTPEQIYTAADVIKGSFDINFASAVSTDFTFTNPQNKTLTVLPTDFDFNDLESTEWGYSNLIASSKLFRYRMEIEAKMRFIVDIENVYIDLINGQVYRLVFTNGNGYAIGRLESISPKFALFEELQMVYDGDALLGNIPFGSLIDDYLVDIYLSDPAPLWKGAVNGSVDISYTMAAQFANFANRALSQAGRHIVFLKQYADQKINIECPDSIRANILLRTVEHNSYNKLLLTFSIPIEKFSNNLLQYCRVKFGIFRENSLKGWIVYWSLDTTSDKVTLQFLSDKAFVKNLYDENKLEEPITINEDSDNYEKTISEVLKQY